MREILFRGKRIDNDKWVEGFYCQRKEKIFGGVKTRHMILVPDADSYSGARWIDVNPTTVGQYTGLTDKNDEKIFEGDILKIYPDYDFPDDFDVSKVYSFNGVLCVDYCTPEYDSTALGFLCELDDVAYEVIGNIHDNPELLEGKP